MCAIVNQAQTSAIIRGAIVRTLPSVLQAKLVQLIQLLTYPTLAQELWGRQLWQRKRQQVTGGRLASSASTAACKMNYLATPLTLRGLMHTDDIETSHHSHFYSRLVGRALAQAVRRVTFTPLFDLNGSKKALPGRWLQIKQDYETPVV